MNGPEHPETMEIANFWLLVSGLAMKIEFSMAWKSLLVN